PFFRAAVGTEGTGLGLAIVREIAQSHRGAVSLSPGADGRGVRACVVLARWQPALVAEPEKEPL
ncbi:ATP-binding protein, partial [Paraburkholderia sp. BR14261]